MDDFEGGLDDVPSDDGGGIISSIESAWDSFVSDYEKWWSDDTPVSTGGPTIFDPIIQGAQSIGDSIGNGIEDASVDLLWILGAAIVILILIAIIGKEF